MEIVIFTAIIISSVIIAIQDFTTRYIHILMLLIWSCAVILYNNRSINEIIMEGSINILYLLTVFLLLYIYVKLRKGKKEQLINRYIGLGDLLILIAPALLYGFLDFVMLILVACFIALLYWFINVALLKKRIIRIPFAGIFVLTNTVLCCKLLL